MIDTELTRVCPTDGEVAVSQEGRTLYCRRCLVPLGPAPADGRDPEPPEGDVPPDLRPLAEKFPGYWFGETLREGATMGGGRWVWADPEDGDRLVSSSVAGLSILLHRANPDTPW